MYAIRQYSFGGVENLLHEEVPDPLPGPGQVRIRVAAAGVHLMDTVLRAGAELGMPLPALPMTPGREAAGRIDMVGPGVDPVWKNRRVVAYLGHESSGGYAELALAEVSSLHELPETLSESAAVAMIGTGRTTVGILEQAGLGADDVVLVTAAAGGIGALLVQAAHNAGATVIGLAGSADKAEFARRQGARAGVDYSARGWQDDLRAALGTAEVTVVFDGVGGGLGRSVAEFLVAGGRHLFYGWASEWGQFTTFTPEELAERGITTELVVGPKMYSRPGGVRALEEQALAEAVAGVLSPTVQTFRLADAAAAHTALESRTTKGKVVLVP